MLTRSRDTNTEESEQRQRQQRGLPGRHTDQWVIHKMHDVTYCKQKPFMPCNESYISRARTTKMEKSPPSISPSDIRIKEMCGKPWLAFIMPPLPTAVCHHLIPVYLTVLSGQLQTSPPPRSALMKESQFGTRPQSVK